MNIHLRKFRYNFYLLGGEPTAMFALPILSELYLKTLFGRDFSQFHNVKHIKHDIIYLSMPTLMEMAIIPISQRMILSI